MKKILNIRILQWKTLVLSSIILPLVISCTSLKETTIRLESWPPTDIATQLHRLEPDDPNAGVLTHIAP